MKVIVCINRADVTDILVYRSFDDVPDDIMDNDAGWYVIEEPVRPS